MLRNLKQSKLPTPVPHAKCVLQHTLGVRPNSHHRLWVWPLTVPKLPWNTMAFVTRLGIVF